MEQCCLQRGRVLIIGVSNWLKNKFVKRQQTKCSTKVERSHSTFKVRRGGREEIPFVQGKEQRLRFAEAAVKRYPTSKVRETQIRQ